MKIWFSNSIRVQTESSFSLCGLINVSDVIQVAFGHFLLKKPSDEEMLETDPETFTVDKIIQRRHNSLSYDSFSV